MQTAPSHEPPVIEYVAVCAPRLLPKRSKPATENSRLSPAVILALAGVTTSSARPAGTTDSSAVPVTSPTVTVTVCDPGFVEVQTAPSHEPPVIEYVAVCAPRLLPKRSSPSTENSRDAPATTVDRAGLTTSSASAAGCTTSSAVAVTSPTLTVTVCVPGFVDVQTAPSHEPPVIEYVAVCAPRLLPNRSRPSTENSRLSPAVILAVAGLTTSSANAAGTTVSSAVADTSPTVAVTVCDPGFVEVQTAPSHEPPVIEYVAVRAPRLLPKRSTPSTENSRLSPAVILALAGVTTSSARPAGTTDSSAVADTSPTVAVTV